MKSTLYKILILGLVFAFSSCKKAYLETKPVDQLTDEEMFKNIANTKAALNGTYRLLYQRLSGNDEDGHTSMMVVMDFLGEDIVFSARGTDTYYYTYRWQDHRSSENSLPLFAYRLYYRIIDNANIILEKIDGIPDATDSDKKNIKGECLALRAFAHFMLVQLFGKRYDATLASSYNPSLPAKDNNANSPQLALGVPVMLKHSLAPQQRATVDSVYKRINMDLDSAIIYLNGTPKRLYKTHIDKSVAMGLKARVCLTQQNWAEAIYYSMQAVQPYSLMSRTDYLSGFNNLQNDEWMWGAQIKEEQTSPSSGFFAFMSSNFNSIQTRTNPKLINKQLYNTVPLSDVRRLMWCDDVNDVENFPGVINGMTLKPVENQLRFRLMHNKFRVANPVSRGGDVPFMRAAEMYLIAAEAYTEMGNTAANISTAQDYLYTLAKNRDPLYEKSQDRTDPPGSIPSQGTFRTELRYQRRIELWGEGFRFLDLKRQNEPLSRGNLNTTGVNSVWANVTSVSAGANSWQFKIPLREIQATGMPQNP